MKPSGAVSPWTRVGGGGERGRILQAGSSLSRGGSCLALRRRQVMGWQGSGDRGHPQGLALVLESEGFTL